MRALGRHPIVWALVAGVLSLASGCATSLRDAQLSYRADDLETAAAILAREADDHHDDPDGVILLLELGSTLHALGEFERSTGALAAAERRIAELDEKARTSVTEEAWVTATNPEQQTYRGTPNDRVMAATYRGLNALMLGDPDAARPAFVEASFQQDDALRRLEDELDGAERGAAAEQRFDASRTVGDPGLQRTLDERYADLQRYRPYDGFANPFADLSRAIFLLSAQVDASDADQAATLLRRVVRMVPDNTFARADLEAAEVAAGGRPVRGVTYVVFATGVAPIREGFRLDMPLFLFTNEVDYVGVTFPYLVFSPAHEPYLVVEAGGESVRTETIADMDRVIAAEFERVLPALITRTIVGAGAKAAASWGAIQATQGTDWLEALVRLGFVAYQAWQNRTDRRGWATLPKLFQYGRIDTPADGRIRVSLPSGGGQEVLVDPEAVNLVLVRSVSPGGRVWISSAGLRREDR